MANDNKSRWIKIGFEQAVQDLIERGPTTTVGIAASGHYRPVTHALTQVDTGSGATAISPRLVEALKLKAIDSAVVQELGREPITTDFFQVTIFVPEMHFDVDAARLEIPPPHDILIGRDILSRFRLSVDFLTGITALHFRNDP